MNLLEKESISVRQDIITMLHHAGSGHPGGSLSVADILVSLYNRISVDPSAPQHEDRDRVIISKGHAAPAVYAVLAEHGFFLKDEFKRLRKLGGSLQGHPDKNKTPGIDGCSGSLGQGFSTAVGIALAGKVKKKDYQVYAVLGDGEMQEGIVWEAAMSAAHYKLDNLTMIIDWNGLQIDGSTDQVMSLGNIKEKMSSFGFDVVEADGHDFESLECAWNHRTVGKPKCVIAKTIKGKGISYMEGDAGWHGKTINDGDFQTAMNELEKRTKVQEKEAECNG